MDSSDGFVTDTESQYQSEEEEEEEDDDDDDLQRTAYGVCCNK